MFEIPFLKPEFKARALADGVSKVCNGNIISNMKKTGSNMMKINSTLWNRFKNIDNLASGFFESVFFCVIFTSQNTSK